MSLSRVPIEFWVLHIAKHGSRKGHRRLPYALNQFRMDLARLRIAKMPLHIAINRLPTRLIRLPSGQCAFPGPLTRVPSVLIPLGTERRHVNRVALAAPAPLSLAPT